MAEKKIIRIAKKKVRVKSKKKVAPLSKQTEMHISKSEMLNFVRSYSWLINRPIDGFEDEICDCKSCYEVLNQQELEDFER